MHPSMVSILRAFDDSHLENAPDDVKLVFGKCADLANWMVVALPSSSEVVAGLRKLLEAKDCFVRQAAWSYKDAMAAAAEGSNEA